MKRTFHTDRKAMVKAVSEALGIPSKYLGAPTMSYQIGSINIDRNGTLTTENKEEGEKAMAALKEQGIIPEEGPVENTAEQAADLPPIDSLEISIPRDKMTEDQLNNLKKLVEAKSTLIRHAFQTENTDLTVTDDKTIFPWFQTPCSSDEAFAYTTFVGKLCEMVRKQKRITATEKEVDNEKYAFRCFLLRLGLIGKEYKMVRKILLRNLSGSSAFKSGKKPEPAADAAHAEAPEAV